MHDKVIEFLKKALEPLESVHAGWLEGSMATGHADELSDIDIWFDVEDEAMDEVFSAVAAGLEKEYGIAHSFEQKKPNNEIRNVVYLLKGAGETFQVDVCLQAHSRDFIFTRDVVDQDIKVLFDKDGTIKYQDLDEKKLRKENLDRLEYLESRYKGMRPAVIRQIKRGKYLETYEYYFHWVLEPVVQVLRIAYQPTKAEDYRGLKHVYRDLPTKTVDQIEDLYKVTSVEEISEKLDLADKLFQEATTAARK